MKYSTFKIAAFVTIVSTLTACSGSGLSEDDVQECILALHNLEDFDEPMTMKGPMGIPGQTLLMADIEVGNIVQQDEFKHVAYVTLELGISDREMHPELYDGSAAHEKQLDATASLSGMRRDGDFMYKKTQAKYLFMKGTKGWSCQQMDGR